MSKYGARKVVVTADGTLFDLDTIRQLNLIVEGKVFDSKMEGMYYQELLWMKKDGAIRDIFCHPVYVLQEDPKITYVADFLITFSDGQQVVIDVKGKETPTFRVKMKLFKSRYTTELRVITYYRGRWVQIEEVKKEKAAHKRALNKLIKQVEQKGRIKRERQPKR